MHAAAFGLLHTQTQTALARLSAEVKDIVPAEVHSWSVAVAELPAEAQDAPLLAAVSAWAGKSKNCLYFIECPSSSDVDLSAIASAFSLAKAHETRDRAYARLNGLCNCLYVGSSQSVAKRLAEHLGYGARKTYALQLLHWARPLALTLEFVCAKYSNHTPFHVVQAFEDTLWQLRQPMFGRQGRK